jgi:hypothetical protein
LSERPRSREVARERLVRAARDAFAVADRLGFKSYDPYDILLSPYAGPLASHAPLAARVLLQIGRRSGVRFRQLLRVPAHEEPKAIADYLRAATMLGRAGEEWAVPYAGPLSARLRACAHEASSGLGWGIRFPWVSRFGAMAADEPNVYTTTVACQAFLDDHFEHGREASLEAAVDGALFILHGLGSFTYGGRNWLRYAAGSTTPIVNVQASAASLFARLNEQRTDEEFAFAADRAAAVAVALQRQDGSWPYSEDERGSFVDGFHTGFTLQGLIEYSRSRGRLAVAGTDEAVGQGFSYFKQHLLNAEGRPRGFVNGPVSRDSQTVAQAIQTLVVCGDEADADAARRIWLWSVPGRHLERPFPALRWALGPFVVATAFLLTR